MRWLHDSKLYLKTYDSIVLSNMTRLELFQQQCFLNATADLVGFCIECCFCFPHKARRETAGQKARNADWMEQTGRLRMGIGMKGWAGEWNPTISKHCKHPSSSTTFVSVSVSAVVQVGNTTHARIYPSIIASHRTKLLHLTLTRTLLPTIP